MSYYQKYRSEKVADLDLVSVRSAFEAMMNSGQIAHAYLFVGPRGLGKTSAARILARLVNCQKNNTNGQLNKKLIDPCGECGVCLSIKQASAVDVMEIDAASHRSIDDIRQLRQRVNLAPAALPKKVYIIDEVHMLTSEAFNALLKTLEEPPAHVMFILCTTEAHKVPETIVSRCVRINFTKATKEELMSSLRRAVKGEKIKVDDEVLAALAEGLDGSFREGHKLLEQIANTYQKITVNDVQKTLGSVGNDDVEALLSAVEKGDSGAIIELMKELEGRGVEVINLVTKLLHQLQIMIRQEIEQKGGISGGRLALVSRLVKVVPKVKISPLPLLPLEMALVRAAAKKSQRQPPTKGLGTTIIEKIDIKPTEKGKIDFEQVTSGWHDLLARLQPRNHSVAGLLRSAKPKEVDDKFLTIEVFYKFHKDQLDQEARRKIIEEEIAKLWGPISVRCILGERKTVDHRSSMDSKSPVVGVENDIKAVEEIFGV